MNPELRKAIADLAAALTKLDEQSTPRPPRSFEIGDTRFERADDIEEGSHHEHHRKSANGY